MRFTRAAKVAAFPLTALILVALVACQGPAGPAGTTGTTGTQGPTGPTGPTGGTGGPGFDTLTARGTGPLVVLINDGKAADDSAVIGPLPDPIDMSMHFRGGYEPVTYAAKMVDASESTFTGDIDPDTGILTIKLRDEDDTETMNQYEIGTNPTQANEITVTAKDAESNEAMMLVHVLANKAPVAPQPGEVWATSVGTEMRADKKVVVCQDEANAAIAATDTAHQCTVEAGASEFTDDGDFVLSVVETSSMVSVSADGKKLTITGLASTWDADADPAADDPAEVMIRATDKNGLYVDRALEITVDAAPTVKRQIQNRTIKDNAGATIVARNFVNFFDDDQSDLVATDISYEESDANTATATTNGANLEITPLNPGTTMITVTIEEPDGFEQKVSQTFMVTVTNASP